MVRMLRPLTRAVTYKRWLHMVVAIVWPSLWIFIQEAWWTQVTAAVLLGLAGLVPITRVVEGFQARLLLIDHRQEGDSPEIATTPSATWGDRGRTVVWLEARLVFGWAVAHLSLQLPLFAIDLLTTGLGLGPWADGFVTVEENHWWHAVVAPVPLILCPVVVVWSGRLINRAGRAAPRAVARRADGGAGGAHRTVAGTHAYRPRVARLHRARADGRRGAGGRRTGGR
ncbi:two-component system sensor kinase [Streptomyces viridochromogenes DSM 40736]|uniref:Two-component system sensor kinase n=1 Tax=Streptomyces viridochromogenes (strain DSM 40736 / JCM 4977 / BCRC 1201 / Tue 494) TaxID=591159 RepID=D9XGK8_STRVT|nr:two-component system sensor kinase [Streptomyces viridochromogenes DSM 40736]